MKRLLRANAVPYHGWTWQCKLPACPVEIKGRTQDEMAELAAIHLKGNNQPVGMGFAERILDEMCEQHFERWGVRLCTEMKHPVPFIREAPLTVEQITVGTITIGDWQLRYGGVPVSAEEIQRRAAICLHGGENGTACPKHVSVAGCQGCSGGKFREVLSRYFGRRLTGEATELQACEVCGCALKGKVQVPLECIHAHAPAAWNEKFPDFCWAKKKDA